jgi:SAM-dependent methyltransferase
VSTTVLRGCKLCGGPTEHKFSLELASGLTGEYHECKVCHLLQSFHLDGLDEKELGAVYGVEGWDKDPDPGATWRLSYVSRRLEHLARTRMFPRLSHTNVLDFGSGSGFLVGYLSHRLGVTAWGYEPYAPSVFAAERTLRDWDEVVDRGPYHLVIASEVFEHFVDPLTEIDAIRHVLAQPNALFITTGRYVPGRHGSDWSYLAPHGGQHVAFFSAGAMQEVARRLGHTHVYSVGGPNEWLLATPSSSRARIRMGVAAAALRAAARLGLPAKVAAS